MLPATHNFSVVRGTSGPTQGLKVRLKAQDGDDLVNIPFEDVRLSIFQRKTLLLRCTLGNGQLVVTDPTEAEITWIPTADQTRQIPEGLNKARYELEVWQGTSEVVYLLGTITGIGGINDDENAQEIS